MRKNLVVLAFLMVFYPNGIFAQTLNPTFDNRAWKYEECGEQFLIPVDDNYLVWHDDYLPEVKENDLTDSVIVVYRPVAREVLGNNGKEHFLNISRESPWLLLHNVADNDNNLTFHLYEIFGGPGMGVRPHWRHIMSTSNIEELRRNLLERYQLQ